MKPIEILEKEWLRRVELVEQDITPEKTYQRSNLFYNFLFQCKKKGIKPVAFSTFKYNLIYKLEKKHGYMKEDLNIFSKPDAVLYRRFGTEFIQYEHQAYKCIGILTTEKSGIAEPLTGELAKRGILVVDTQGIQSRYAMQIIENYIEMGKPAFTTSDYDVSGCFMMKRYTDIGAIRISLLDVLEPLGIDWDDVVEEDESVRNNHWNSIDQEDKYILKPDEEGPTYRIEMDTVMANVSVGDFAETFLKAMDKYIPVKDVGNVMIPPKYPAELDDLIDEFKRKLKEYYMDDIDEMIEEYNDMKVKLVDLDLEEHEDDAKEKSNYFTMQEHIDMIQEIIDNI